MAEFEVHLVKCTWCAAYLASYKQTVAMTQTLASDQAAETAVPEELVQAILKAVGRTE